MSWNHRVMRRVVKLPSGRRETVYGIREVFYNSRHIPDGYTAEAIAPQGRSIDDLREELVLILKATYDPIFFHHQAFRERARRTKSRNAEKKT